MTDATGTQPSQPETTWLKSYYTMRFLFSAAWAAAAFAMGSGSAGITAALLIAYPAWDAFANYLDARSSGGFARNRAQAINAVISVATAAAVIVALGRSIDAVLAVFGVWAIVAGLLQLRTAASRWNHSGAQWAMILSGAQSALAGGFFVVKARAGGAPVLDMVAGYASIGALYFLISALWLVGGEWLRHGRRG